MRANTNKKQNAVIGDFLWMLMQLGEVERTALISSLEDGIDDGEDGLQSLEFAVMSFFHLRLKHHISLETIHRASYVDLQVLWIKHNPKSGNPPTSGFNKLLDICHRDIENMLSVEEAIKIYEKERGIPWESFSSSTS